MKFDETENRRKLHELLDIVLLCNGYGARKKEETGTAPTMFFEFVGHVGAVDVRLYNNGWDSGLNYDLDWWIPLNAPISDNVVEAIRIAADNALHNRPSEQEQLEADIIKAEEEIKRRKAEITAMKRNLKAMQKKGA